MHLYQTHWWRCNGPCQKRRPHFGIVRRSMNRAPGPSDFWWSEHLRSCGGTFIKIKEPPKEKSTGKNNIQTGKNNTAKPNADITKYIVQTGGTAKPVLNDSGNTKSNSGGPGYIVGKKGVIIAPKPPPIPVFTGNGHTLKTESKHYTVDVTATVRNIWANKQIPTIKEPVKNVNPSVIKPKAALIDPVKGVAPSSSIKHKTKSPDVLTPPTKVRKIDDYFMAKSILSDLYGDDYKLEQSNNGKKLVAVKVEMVDCPICGAKFNDKEINRHLDECLNKDLIEKLSKENAGSVQEVQPSHSATASNIGQLKAIVGKIPSIPAFTPKAAIPESNNNKIGSRNHISQTQTGHRETVIHTTDDQKGKVGGIPSIPAFKPKLATQTTTPESNNQKSGKTQVPIQKTAPSNVRNSLPPEYVDFISPVPAFKPMPSFPEITDDNFIDLTVIDYDTSNIKTVKTDKSRRKTESEASLSSEGWIRKVVPPVPINPGNLTILNEQITNQEVEVKAGPSKENDVDRRCPICRGVFDKSVEEHLDECPKFFKNRGVTKGGDLSMVIEDDEDDILDESQILNETGTKTPCPSCMKMVEEHEMNDHLDVCLDISLVFDG